MAGKDYKQDYGSHYLKGAFIGILFTPTTKVGEKTIPKYICYFCGKKAEKTRRGNGHIILCKEESCRTIASMTGREEWGIKTWRYEREEDAN